MRTLNYIIFSIFFCCSIVSGQDKTQRETKSILSFLISEKRQVYLSPMVDTSSFKSISYSLSSNQFVRRIAENKIIHIDTLNITEKERLFIDSSLNSIKTYKWTEQDLNRVNLKNFNLIGSNPQANTNFNNIEYQIMKPIFFRNNTFCFAFYEYNCGALCGYGELKILKKVKRKWKNWWTLYQIAS